MSTPSYFIVEELSSQLPEIPPDSIVSRTFYSDDQAKVILFGFAKGQELSEHTASKPAILHFIQGEAQLTLGKDQFAAHAGTWVHMPAHMAHSILAKTPVVMMLYLLETAAS
jgi:quercetin dioxygenase-like cupin family protein